MEEKKKFYIIYKITNTINNKIYIGKHITYNINDNYMGSGNLIKKSINKYGIEHFKKDILYIFDNMVDMDQMERNIVNEEFILRLDTYNITTGGYGGFQYANLHKLNNSAGQCYIVSEKLKNEEYNKWFGNKIKEGHKKVGFTYDKFLGRNHSEETIERMKIKHKQNEHQKGNKNSQYGTCWINKDKQNKKIKKEELNFWLEQGWIKGRKIKN